MRIPDKQAIFFELDGVLVEEPRLDEQGRVKWLPDGRWTAVRRLFGLVRRLSGGHWTAVVWLLDGRRNG